MEKIAAEEVAYLKSELNCDEAFLNEALAELGRRIEA